MDDRSVVMDALIKEEVDLVLAEYFFQLFQPYLFWSNWLYLQIVSQKEEIRLVSIAVHNDFLIS